MWPRTGMPAFRSSLPELVFVSARLPCSSSGAPKIKFVPIEPSVTVDMGMITNREDHCPQLDEFRGLVQEALSLRESEMRA